MGERMDRYLIVISSLYAMLSIISKDLPDPIFKLL